jgi:DNA-binding CsgD family transcriptional regulator
MILTAVNATGSQHRPRSTPRHRARRARARPDPRDVDATKLLTPRQRDALQRMSRGLTYEEAAAELGIGLETVKEHLKVPGPARRPKHEPRDRRGHPPRADRVSERPCPGVSGRELRRLADRAHDAGQKPLSIELHDVARRQEVLERHRRVREAERDFLQQPRLLDFIRRCQAP